MISNWQVRRLSPDDKNIKTYICEVVAVDKSRGIFTGRVRTDGGLIVEDILPIDICPEPARMGGGAFHLDVYLREDGKQPSIYCVSRQVDPVEEQMELDELFGPAPETPE